jgi:hypothetical protein
LVRRGKPGSKDSFCRRKVKVGVIIRNHAIQNWPKVGIAFAILAEVSDSWMLREEAALQECACRLIAADMN